jgi:hypothetical protein
MYLRIFTLLVSLLLAGLIGTSEIAARYSE